jgi:hypothetical protein
MPYCPRRRRSSQTILAIVSIGVAKVAPATVHVQYQNKAVTSAFSFSCVATIKARGWEEYGESGSLHRLSNTQIQQVMIVRTVNSAALISGANNQPAEKFPYVQGQSSQFFTLAHHLLFDRLRLSEPRRPSGVCLQLAQGRCAAWHSDVRFDGGSGSALQGSVCSLLQVHAPRFGAGLSSSFGHRGSWPGR